MGGGGGDESAGEGVGLLLGKGLHPAEGGVGLQVGDGEGAVGVGGYGHAADAYDGGRDAGAAGVVEEEEVLGGHVQRGARGGEGAPSHAHRDGRDAALPRCVHQTGDLLVRIVLVRSHLSPI